MTAPIDRLLERAGVLAERLKAWSPLIASGMECPAAALAMDNAAEMLDALSAALRARHANTDQTGGK